MIRAQLHITGPGMNRLFVLEEGITRVGSDFDCDIWLDHPLLSAEHLAVIWADQAATVIIYQNGRAARLNGQLITTEEPQPLSSGDLILAHPYTLAFTMIEIKIGESARIIRPDEADETAAQDDLDPSFESDLAPSAASHPNDLSVPEALMGLLNPVQAAYSPPPGLQRHSIRYIKNLPEIYRSDFVSRFLALLESVMMPVEWTVQNIDLQLDPRTALTSFLPWLAQWFGVTFDSTWGEAARRTFLQEATDLYAMRGTRYGLARILQIYTGYAVEISDLFDEERPFLFRVHFPCREDEVKRELIEKIVMQEKPAHTDFEIWFLGQQQAQPEATLNVMS